MMALSKINTILSSDSALLLACSTSFLLHEDNIKLHPLLSISHSLIWGTISSYCLNLITPTEIRPYIVSGIFVLSGANFLKICIQKITPTKDEISCHLGLSRISYTAHKKLLENNDIKVFVIDFNLYNILTYLPYLTNFSIIKNYLEKIKNISSYDAIFIHTHDKGLVLLQNIIFEDKTINEIKESNRVISILLD